MHSNYYDIEERLRDLNDFESDVDGDVIDDVWNGIENNLIIDNSLSGLQDLEANVSDDIWNGIESNLSGRNRRPVIWWVSGIAASLLLAIFATSQLGDFSSNENLSLSNNSNKTENVSSSNTLNNLSANDNNPIQQYTENPLENNNENKSEALNETSVINNSDNLVKNKVFTNEENNKVNGDTPNLIASTKLIYLNNGVTSSNNVSNPISTIEDGGGENTNINNSALENNNVEDNFNQPTSLSKNAASITNNEETIPSSKIDQNSLTPSTLIEMKKDSLEDLFEEQQVITSLEEEGEDEEKPKFKKWKLMALAGVGNYKIDEQFYEIVKPTIVEPQPVKPQKTIPGDKSAVPIVEEEVPEDENAGLNYQRYSVPVTVSIGGEFAISKSFAIRSGISHTTVNYYYEKYKVGNELQLSYVAIPVLGILAIKEWNNFKISLNTGVRVEKLIGSKYLLIDGNTAKEDLDNNQISSEGVNFATSVGIDLEYKITPNSSISLTPQAVKYISVDSQEVFNRQKRPIWPELNLGYSIKF